MGVEVIIAITLGGAAVLALLWRITVWLHALNQVVQNELTPNGGSSIKDRIAAMHTELSGLSSRFDAYTEQHRLEHREDARDRLSG